MHEASEQDVIDRILDDEGQLCSVCSICGCCPWQEPIAGTSSVWHLDMTGQRERQCGEAFALHGKASFPVVAVCERGSGCVITLSLLAHICIFNLFCKILNSFIYNVFKKFKLFM